MKQPIPRPLHGVTDYSYAAAIAAAPHVAGFSDDKKATLLCGVIGAGTLLTSLFTRYELGLVRVLPFKAHLVGDFLTGLASLSAPWLLGFSDNPKARNTFVGFGVFAILAALLTQPDEME